MTPLSQAASPAPDFSGPDSAAKWSAALRLYPIYTEMAHEFAFDAPACAALEAASDAPDQETMDEAERWLSEIDERIQVHQLRQFLQTSSVVDREAMVQLMRHFLGKTARTASSRDKLDFLLVQYFSQGAPTDLADDRADLAYVAGELEPVLGSIELKAPVWLNGLDRNLESARRCRSLDELLHGGVLEQGRKAKAQAGDLFYMPVALVAFTRYGYLMRRTFFRLMLTDLNNILDGLTELEEHGVETIDCRRAQFSQQEPVSRLRMICQSWKVMFQAEYSSGQPLRMLVDLRASVEGALGRSSAQDITGKAFAATAASGSSLTAATSQPAVKAPARAPAAVKPASTQAASPKPAAKFAVSNEEPPEFEIAVDTPEWNPDENPRGARKK
jgi:hypothetical protein